MQAELVKTFHFEAAHTLVGAPQGHKCRRLHGHNYLVDIHVEGEVDPASGWVIDFGQIAAAVTPLIEQLDHQFLNDVPGLENNTSELLAAWLWQRLKGQLPQLSAITIWESDSSRCIYRGQ